MPVCSWCPLWVSILIQPEGWMLLIFGDDGDDGEVFQSSSSPKAGCYCYGMSGAGNPDKFQSSSSPKAGCYIPHQQIKKWGDGFNPHPARRLDATVYTVKTGRPKTVSILIQPEGWMLPVTMGGIIQQPCFNPHPARRLDATLFFVPLKYIFNRFNPHPARRLDATSWVSDYQSF